MKCIKFVLAITLSLLLSACGGSGGNDDSNNGGSNSGRLNKDLSSEGALTALFRATRDALKKDQFESTLDYDNRMNNYVGTLTGFRATETLRATYNADTEELVIHRPLAQISDGVNHYNTAFNTNYSRLTIENLSEMYEPEIEITECALTDGMCEIQRYRVLNIPAQQAEPIIDGFRVDYSFAFTRDQVDRFENRCISANFTQCINFMYSDVTTIRVYNTVDGQEY